MADVNRKWKVLVAESVGEVGLGCSERHLT